MDLVDFHLHFFSRTFFETLARLSPQPGSVEDKLERVRARTGLELPPADHGEHLQRWMTQLERHHVAHVAAFASVPEEAEVLAQARAAAPDRLTPLAVVDPRAPGVDARVRTLIEQRGFGGVLLFPAMHHYHLGAPEVAPLLEVLDELRAVAYVHCGLLVVKLRDLLGIPRVQDIAYANPLGVIPAANAHPNARFVIPHFGAGFFRETLMSGAQCANVHVDTSSSNSWVATQEVQLSLEDVLRRTLAVFGAQRVLFGTDSGTFPAGWQHERHAAIRGALQALRVSDSDQQALFAGNARRLLARA